MQAEQCDGARGVGRGHSESKAPMPTPLPTVSTDGIVSPRSVGDGARAVGRDGRECGREASGEEAGRTKGLADGRACSPSDLSGIFVSGPRFPALFCLLQCGCDSGHARTTGLCAGSEECVHGRRGREVAEAFAITLLDDLLTVRVCASYACVQGCATAAAFAVYMHVCVWARTHSFSQTQAYGKATASAASRRFPVLADRPRNANNDHVCGCHLIEISQREGEFAE